MLRILLFWLGGSIWCLSNMILNPKILSCGRIYQMEVKRKSFDEALYKRTMKRKFMIESDYGYYLSCELLEPEESDGVRHGVRHPIPIAILCHGFSQGKYRSLIYAEVFLKLGFKVLIYDHRNHGLSGKAYTSMGYYEKYDLKRLVDWCYENYGPACKIVTHGVSMGAATALLHLEIDKRVICTIADCPYSDLKELLLHQLRLYYHIPSFLVPIENLLTFLRAGFWYGQVSPISVVKNIETPILFIHGKRDRYVPTEMSERMYRVKKGSKALYLIAGATHAQAWEVNRRGYEYRIVRFINKHVRSYLRKTDYETA